MLQIQSKMEGWNQVSLQNGRLLGRSEFYSTAYTMQTGKVEFPKCCKYHYHVQDAANTIRYERFYLPHVANARQNERLYLQNDVPHYCSFCKCLLPCFFRPWWCRQLSIFAALHSSSGFLASSLCWCWMLGYACFPYYLRTLGANQQLLMLLSLFGFMLCLCLHCVSARGCGSGQMGHES